MSFRKELDYLKAQPREVKQIKKILPFTVHELGDTKARDEWRAIRAEKERIWEEGRAERYAAAKSRALDVLSGKRKPTVTEQDIADKRYTQIQRQDIERQIAEVRCEIVNYELPLTKPSFWGKLLNFFLNINFEPNK